MGWPQAQQHSSLGSSTDQCTKSLTTLFPQTLCASCNDAPVLKSTAMLAQKHCPPPPVITIPLPVFSSRSLAIIPQPSTAGQNMADLKVEPLEEGPEEVKPACAREGGEGQK